MAHINVTKMRQLCRLIDDFAQDRGYHPTVREIAAQMGLVTSAAYHHLKRAKKLGVLTWRPTRVRTIHTIAGWEDMLKEIERQRRKL